MMDKLKEFTETRVKRFEESSQAWMDLKKFIKPLLTAEEQALLSKIDSHFMMYPIEDVIFITLMSAPLMMMPKMFCIKCGKEIDKDVVVD
jgi:hypothetical protein